MVSCSWKVYTDSRPWGGLLRGKPAQTPVKAETWADSGSIETLSLLFVFLEWKVSWIMTSCGGSEISLELSS